MAHRSRLASLVIDCKTDDLAGAAAFWAAALGTRAEPAEASYMRLGSDDGITVEVQTVDHPSRAHLDIESDDIPAEVARLERLGARKVAAIRTWVVMEAPTGQRFCIIRAQTDRFAAHARTWEA
jgi:predicted enzyme related to lactoylglutathione lyase